MWWEQNRAKTPAQRSLEVVYDFEIYPSYVQVYRNYTIDRRNVCVAVVAMDQYRVCGRAVLDSKAQGGMLCVDLVVLFLPCGRAHF